MAITTIQQVKPIVLNLDSSSDASVYPVFTDSPFTLNNVTIISENIFIKNLKAYVKINSLAAAQLPDISIEDSQVQATYKVLDTEWNSPRKQLNLLISPGANQWFPVGSISLLNAGGYPYRTHNLMDLYTDNLAIELGKDGRLGVQLQNVGTGFLVSDDTITIHGSYTKEIIIDDTLPAMTVSEPLLIDVFDESSVILSTNPNRKYVLLINNSPVDVWINLAGISLQGQGILIKANGGIFELTTSSVNYTRNIAAICESTAQLTGIEGS